MPSQESVSLLLVNEQAEEVKLTTISIRGFYPGCRVETVYSAADALEWSSRDDWHVILLDEHLAHGKESFLLPELKKRVPHAALIVQAERSDTTVAMQVMHAGADYYLFKESPAFLSELLIVTRKAVEQRELHRRLDLTEERYLRLLETMTDIAYELDANGSFRFVSPLVKVVLGYAPEELAGRHFSQLVRPEERGAAERRFNERRTGIRSSRNFELRLLPKDVCPSSIIDVVEINATGLYDRHKQYVGTLGVIRSRARIVPVHLSPPALESPSVPSQSPEAPAPQTALEQPSGPERMRAADRYRALVANLAEVTLPRVAEARQQIKELVGEIKLVPTAEGYLEAQLTGSYSGLVKLAVGTKLNNLVAGEGFEPSTFGLCVPRQLSLPGQASLRSGLSLHPRTGRAAVRVPAVKSLHLLYRHQDRQSLARGYLATGFPDFDR